MPYKDPEARRAYNRIHSRNWHRTHPPKDPEAKRMYQRMYTKANAEAIAKKNKARYKAKKAKVLAQKKAYYQANKDAILAKRKQYVLTNLAKIRADQKAYQQAHPEVYRTHSERHRARKRGAAICDLTPAQWRKILEAYGHRCVYCGRKMQRLTQDHIIPISKGGNHTFSNVVPACQRCNSTKHDGPVLCPIQPLLLLA